MSKPVSLDKVRAGKILAGDQRAFQALFDEYFPRLYRFALGRLEGNEDAAREVVQQTFVNGFERLDSYRGEAALYTWFCRICHNALVDHCRRRNMDFRRLVPIDDHPEMQAVLELLSTADTEWPEAEASRRDAQRLVQSVLDYLPDHYGNALEWKYVEGLSVAEIAERMGAGQKAVESLLTRARNAFRRAMGALSGASGQSVESTVVDGNSMR